ncbi:MAG: nucleotidyl transferase AbiEii/AbiGii toxin family protein [Patescibacteria group bacterium]|nr:nucleotidyl transferase AbiEii/AbiGii toxin family protein [Patescibacteria group bacterium]
MQHPIDFMNSLQAVHGRQRFNILREYLQVMTLMILYGIKGSEHLRFGGGTCLRICHNLPRYSEDMDFSLGQKGVDTTKIIEQLQNGFQKYNVDFHLSVPKSVEKKRIAKYWLRFPDLLYQLDYSTHKSEKLAIKFEIDKHPPKKGKGEFFYVSKFNTYFPIFKNDLPTLFAGKIGAVCQRGYHAMRDFYDLLWYLNNNIEPNYAELKEIGLKATDRESLVELLEEKTKNIDGQKLFEDLEGFLENSAEKNILYNYPAVFEQSTKKFLAFQ